jgi:hypothetical protein
MHLGIAGFEPMWLTGLDTIRRAHGERLARLAGRRLTAVDLVYFVEDGSWFADTPVVLDFAGECVEICHQKFDDLSITWNTIDRSTPITGWEESDFSPRWRTGQPLLDGLVGGVVREVALLEWRDARDMADGMVAVEYTLDTGRLAIANALDENVIETGTTAPEYLRHILDADD